MNQISAITEAYHQVYNISQSTQSFWYDVTVTVDGWRVREATTQTNALFFSLLNQRVGGGIQAEACKINIICRTALGS